jgi:hypothetical protein
VSSPGEKAPFPDGSRVRHVKTGRTGVVAADLDELHASVEFDDGPYDRVNRVTLCEAVPWGELRLPDPIAVMRIHGQPSGFAPRGVTYGPRDDAAACVPLLLALCNAAHQLAVNAGLAVAGDLPPEDLDEAVDGVWAALEPYDYPVPLIIDQADDDTPERDHLIGALSADLADTLASDARYRLDHATAQFAGRPTAELRKLAADAGLNDLRLRD